MAILKQVESNRDLKSFLYFPFWLYENNLTWVKPNPSALKNYFNRNKNPFFKSGDARLYVVMDDRRVAGRVAVFANHAELVGEEKTVRFGFLDFENNTEISALLFEAIHDSAKELNATQIVGCTGFADDNFEFATQKILPNAVLPNQRPDYFFRQLRSNGFDVSTNDHFFVIKHENQTRDLCRFLTIAEALKLVAQSKLMSPNAVGHNYIAQQIQSKNKIVVACGQTYFVVAPHNKAAWQLPFTKKQAYKSAVAQHVLFTGEETLSIADCASVQEFLQVHLAQKIYFKGLRADQENSDLYAVAGKILSAQLRLAAD
jgi:hypothetical protein